MPSALQLSGKAFAQQFEPRNSLTVLWSVLMPLWCGWTVGMRERRQAPVVCFARLCPELVVGAASEAIPGMR